MAVASRYVSCTVEAGCATLDAVVDVKAQSTTGGRFIHHTAICVNSVNYIHNSVSLFHVIDTGSIRARISIYPSPLAQTLAMSIYPHPYWEPQSASGLW